MSFYEVTQIDGGTYSTGTDWSAQFDDENAAGYLKSSLLTSTGEAHLPYAAVGRRARLAIKTSIPFTLNFYVENEGGGTDGVQIRAGGVIVGEYTTPTADSIDIEEGVTVLEMVFEKGQLFFAAMFLAETSGNLGARQWPLYGVGGGTGGLQATDPGALRPGS